jgi:hypothetical protein
MYSSVNVVASDGLSRRTDELQNRDALTYRTLLGAVILVPRLMQRAEVDVLDQEADPAQRE